MPTFDSLADLSTNPPVTDGTATGHGHDHIPETDHTHDDEHSHETGPNGGVVFDLSKYHAESTVDHPENEAIVLLITGDEKDAKPMAVAAKEYAFTNKETETADGTVVPPMRVKLVPVDVQEGKAAKFVGKDPGIGNIADLEGTVLGEIDGKPPQATFKE